MKLDEIVAWYQKKIGTYDKQQWEKTVEQKILDGFSSVTLKTAKLKTEFIDVDLVRGSTFPKAKPKQTLLTVIRLAVLRYLFLPVYATWWVKQTSPNVFVILLLIYITQMVNWAVYTYNVHRLERYSTNSTSNASGKLENVTSSTLATNHVMEPHIISLTDLLIPMALSLLLSLIHSQIVATNTASGAKVNRRRFSNGSQNGKQPSREPSRMRRRKKFVKIRSQDGCDGVVFSILQQQQQQKRKPLATQLLHSGVEVLTKSQINTLSEGGCTNAPIEMLNSTSPMRRSPFRTPSAILKLELNSAVGESDCNDKYTENVTLQKKRNVNWHSSLHDFVAETQEKQQQTSPQQLSSTTTTTATNSSQASTPSNAADSDTARGITRDAMATGNSSSSSGSRSPNKSMQIDESVQEFYDDLIDITDRNLARAAKRVVGEDDGFESLNGKSSSGEEITHTTLSTTTVAVPGQQHLRLRLNTGDPRSRPVDDDDVCRHKLVPLSLESDYEKKCKKMQARTLQISSDETEEEGDDGEVGSSPPSVGNNLNYNECTTSATEWLGVTTNSEECSYSSELEHSDEYKNNHMSDEDGYDLDFTPTTILNSHGATDRISCTIWAQREIKKAQMSVLEISSCIIDRVESMPETNDYIYIGIGFSLLLSLIPTFCRLCEVTLDADKSNEINYLEMPMLLWEKASFSLLTIFGFAFGHTHWERIVLVIGIMQRLCLTTILFIIFAVAERTFKQRFLYAKLFSHLTSSRRARKSNLPHFRLNKVRNIKTWLSVRSYLKKRGPQRSVDVIVSAAFMVTLLLLAFLSVEWLKDSVHMHSHLNLEALLWSTAIGIFLLRFMTLGNKIHTKYRSISVLITEQINLYLQIEQKPKKKDELMVSNSVLKLAADLLKELDTPFKISGLSANPYLFTTVKVVILSALSGVLSEMLGFKLKLHKIKIK